MTVTPDATRCGQTAAVTDAGAVLEDTTAVEIDTTNATGVDVVVTVGGCQSCLGNLSDAVNTNIVDVTDLNTMIGRLRWANAVSGEYKLVKGDPVTGAMYQDCANLSDALNTDTIDVTDLNTLIGWLRYAKAAGPNLDYWWACGTLGIQGQ
jgi:hypothetical protein